MAVETPNSSTDIQIQTPGIGPLFDAQHQNPQNPEALPKYLKILDELIPPLPDPSDERDQEELLILNLLGDLTLPRSLLPAIRAIQEEEFEMKKEKFKALAPVDLPSWTYPGFSPETDEAMLNGNVNEKFKKMRHSRQMLRFRQEAKEIYERYYISEFPHHSSTEAHFTRTSFDLWERMRAHAKDYLTWGDRTHQVDADEKGPDDVITEIRALMASVERINEPDSIHNIHIETDETKSDIWSANEIRFKLTGGRIDRLIISEFSKNHQEGSPLLAYLRSIKADEYPVINISPDGFDIGDFNVFFRNHDMGNHEYGIDLNTWVWHQDEIFAFLRGYVTYLQSHTRAG